MAKKPPPRRPGRADPLGRTIEALHLMRDGRHFARSGSTRAKP